MAEVLKCYVVEEESKEELFESHFDLLPEVGDILINHEGRLFEIVKRLHHLNSRGWTDHYTLWVRRVER